MTTLLNTIWQRIGGGLPIAAALAALLATWGIGRRAGRDNATARAAETEQQTRKHGDAAVADAQRTGAGELLRRGRF